MKHLIDKVLGLAIAVSGLSGCTGLDIDRQEAYPSHRVTIDVNGPGTKTTMTEGVERATFKWSADDASRFVIKENDATGTGISLNSSDEYATMSLEATFAGPDSESYTYSAFMAAGRHNGYPMVPSTQTCSAGGYDPDADILVAQGATFGSRQDHLTMRFGRPVVINKMTLKGLTAGETISEVVISADKDLTGYYSPSDDEWTGQSSTIYLSTSQTVPASGEITVYFVSMPVDDAMLTVSAKSGNYIFKKSFGRGISFILDQVTTFGVSGLTRLNRYKTDVLNQGVIGQSGTSYADFAGKTVTSSAVYAGNSAADYSSIQLRSNNNNSGIITTSSGGIATRVAVTWNSHTTSGRTLQIYGKNTAYSSATELYDAGTSGTLLGTIVYGTSTQLSISGEYQYIGMKSSSGAMYLDDISITWLDDSGIVPVATASVTTVGSAGVSFAAATLYGSFNGATGTIYETGFYWGTDPENLANVATTDGMAGSSGNFSLSITSLQENTTYYYKAYVLEYNQSTSSYEERFAGNVLSFTTGEVSSFVPSGWLELPSSSTNADFTGTFYGSGGNTAANRNYSYTYSYTWYASMWVAYPLAPAHTSGSGSTSSWRYNPDIANAYQVNIVSSSYPSMYGASAYARGHQIPNADRKSDDMMNLQTYYSTNQTPQLQNKFNGSIWGALEGAVRDELTAYGDTIFVATGPCYRKAGGSEGITYLTGANGKSANPASLPVPNYYWKALLKVSRSGNSISGASAIGFWFEHRDYESVETYDQFAVSVDQIEAWTGFNLFANLPDALQSSAEANTSWAGFKDF